jgi:hypothetical protein
MGIGRDFAEAIIREHSFMPLAGDVVTIGRQTIYLPPGEAVDLARDHGVLAGALDEVALALDRTTVNRTSERPLISDAAFFALLGVKNVRVVDQSNYEGAEIIHDLSLSIPAGLEGCADVIIDGSSLDNIFDPVTALTNYARMLRPGGRLLAINAWTPHPTAYVLASPLWLLDYFVANAWADCKVYLLGLESDVAANVFYCDPSCLMERGRPSPNLTLGCEMTTILVAEKGPASTTHRRPIQHNYRSAEDWAGYRQNLGAFALAARPHIVRSRGPLAFDAVPAGHLYIDRYYQALDPQSERHRLTDIEDRFVREIKQTTRDLEDRFAHRIEQTGTDLEDRLVHRIEQTTTDLEDRFARGIEQTTTDLEERSVHRIEQSSTDLEDRFVRRIEQTITDLEDRFVLRIEHTSADLEYKFVRQIEQSRSLRSFAHHYSPGWARSLKRFVFGVSRPD